MPKYCCKGWIMRGWAIAAEEREWKYRLSIYYVKLLDSGTFTCTTPRGLSNSVNVNIKGWAIAAEEREWKYRLSIYYVKLLDSGTFTCTTPRGLSNSVNVNIKAVHCDRLSLRSHERLSTKIDGHRLGQMAHFTCPAGTIREGPANITCMANDFCPPAIFQCSWGYQLKGPPDIVCQKNGSWSGAIPECNGQWSGEVPTCQQIICPKIVVENPYLTL
ncbi:locomotion-related protein Hikaru genki-like, partial [Diaphorina citri]|uniref:Locomotion-related protein Hikaru genki-like n=1 Tax=Diaphorina citri TaxID=121845 RepID=A0A3Q0J7L4_DIACI